MKSIGRIMTGSCATVVATILMTSCGGGGQPTPPPLMQPPGADDPDESAKLTITIGNLSDLTGPSASAQTIINMALDDVVHYYNEENLIPGVELKVVTYDGQLDPSKDIPGYEWLRGKGADFIFSGVPGSSRTLKQRVDSDRVVMFPATATLEELTPPGYVFSFGTIPQHEAYTMLKWIAENDWDYERNGPAKIGGSAWDDGYSGVFFDAMEEYADVHPDQFAWEGGHLTNFSFTWGPEVEALKDCDYVFPCNVMASFVNEYRQADYEAKFIGVDPHMAFLGLISDADLWDEIDGMLVIRASRWWNEEGTVIDLTNKVLRERHPGEAHDVIASGVGYIAFGNLYIMLDTVREAVEMVGPQGFDSEALYEAATSYSFVVDGIERVTYGESKRYATDYYGMYEARGAEKDIFRADPQWQPKLVAP